MTAPILDPLELVAVVIVSIAMSVAQNLRKGTMVITVLRLGVLSEITKYDTGHLQGDIFLSSLMLSHPSSAPALQSIS